MTGVQENMKAYDVRRCDFGDCHDQAVMATAVTKARMGEGEVVHVYQYEFDGPTNSQGWCSEHLAWAVDRWIETLRESTVMSVVEKVSRL